MIKSRPRTSLHLIRKALPQLLALGLAPLSTACSGDETTQPDTQANGFDEIVYAVRQHTTRDAEGNAHVVVAEGMGQVMDYRRYVPGGRIEVKNLASGETRNILAGDEYALADVVGLDLSFDARKITFSMRRGGDDAHYHVYTANLEAQIDSVVTDGAWGPDPRPATSPCSLWGPVPPVRPRSSGSSRPASTTATDTPRSPSRTRPTETSSGARCGRCCT